MCACVYLFKLFSSKNISVLYFIMFADSISRANVKEKHGCTSRLPDFKDQFPWVLILLFLRDQRFLGSGKDQQ